MTAAIGIAFIGSGIGMLAYRGLLGYRLSRAVSWPSVRGVVTGSSLEHECASPAGGCFKPVIRYSYTVGGDAYESANYFFGRQAFTHLRGAAEKLVSAHPAGAEVAVFYDPANPRNSCLRLKLANPGVFGKFGAALVLLGSLFLSGVLKV